ncbi:MAG: hypothetical protein QXL57_08815 [Candidatus Bathyarchaeia archaeon]
MPLKDECGICGRVLPYAYLRRCQRCGKLFCKDCMVPDVSTGDRTKMLCLHCARKIVSPKSTTKYGALTNYLKFRAAFTNTVKLSLAEIDGIIKDNLPINAYKNEEWWNNPTNAHAKAWIDAGWKVQKINLKEGYVIFQKVKKIQAEGFKKKAEGKETKKPFTPVPARFPKSKKPSKTKVSKLYARLKNIERQKTAMPLYPGSFKQKPTHEKKLFKPEKKPQV